MRRSGLCFEKMTEWLQHENRLEQGWEKSSQQAPAMGPTTDNGGLEQEVAMRVQKSGQSQDTNRYKWQLLENKIKGNEGRVTYWLLSNWVGDDTIY